MIIDKVLWVGKSETCVQTRNMFVRPDQLSFDLATLIESAVADWLISQPKALGRPLDDSRGDFLVEAMDRYGLRRLDSDAATFNDEATEEDFRMAVYSAMDHWFAAGEIAKNPTQRDRDAYNRPLGE